MFSKATTLYSVSFITFWKKKKKNKVSHFLPDPPLSPPPPLLWFQHANLVSAPQRDSLALAPVLAAIVLPPLWDPKINIPGPNKIITDTN